MATLELVPASAGKRLGAAILDWLGPAVVLAAAFSIGFGSITQTRSNGFIVYDTALLFLLGGTASGATLVYAIVLLAIEARKGNTIGNQVMGIRSTDPDGYAPGGGAVFLRGLVTGAGLILAVLAAVLMGAFGWLAVAPLVVGPLMLLGVAWAIVVVVSSAWDRNGKQRGWHDKAAKTLAFDVNAGRNPVLTGGIQGPYSFAPVDLPPVQAVASPLPGSAASRPAVIDPLGGLGGQPLAVTSHPDDAVELTRLRSDAPAPGAEQHPVLRITIDDGQDVELRHTALLGRNPAAQPGEAVDQLVPVSDPGRSISKTHLHLKREADGIWITDRNSTNGSAVTTPDGAQTRLYPGHAVFVRPGSAVHFGDRTFHVGQA